MKAVRNVLAGLSLLTLASLAAHAATVEQAYLETCRKDPGVPVPISVVSPTVGAEHLGEKVEVEFVVDQAGKPTGVAVMAASDSTLAEAVVEAVSQWKFKPAEHNGVPVATKVRLPVKVVEPAEGSLFASN